MENKKGFWLSTLICLIGAAIFNAVVLLIMIFLSADQRLGMGYILAAHDMFIFPISAIVLGVVGKFKNVQIVKGVVIGYLVLFFAFVLCAILFGD